MMITNHTFSNLVLRPNGVNPNTLGARRQARRRLPGRGLHSRTWVPGCGPRTATRTSTGGSSTTPPGRPRTGPTTRPVAIGYTFEIGPNEFHPPYPEVVDEYLGAGKYAGKGNREAYLIALEHAVDTRFHGVLRGRAPKGGDDPAGEELPDPHLGGLVQGRSGHPDQGRVGTGLDGSSTLPRGQSFVRGPTRSWARRPFRKEDVRGPAIGPNEHVDHEFVLNGPADLWRTSLDWPTPDDLDLEVYRKASGGELTEGRLLGEFDGDKERADLYGANRPATTS